MSSQDPRMDSLSSYGRDRYNNPIPTDDDSIEPSTWTLAYTHPTLARYVPSEKIPHLDALQAAGLLDQLTVDQVAAIVIIAQTAYRNGQRAQGAEKIDNDAVWVDGIGGIERQPDGAWLLTAPDKPKGGEIISSREAQAIATAKGIDVPISSITHACRQGHIDGAQKHGRDWLFVESEFWRWLNNRPKPGRKPKSR